jgi:hypothetical protein
MDGKFILSREKHFEQLKQNEKYYSDFFEKSFGYELVANQDYAFLSSYNINEVLSRNISIFFSILCYELDKAGKNFLDQLEFSEFSADEIDEYFENSSYYDLIQSNTALNDSNKRRNFINQLIRLKIMDRQGDNRYSFTPAYRLFIDYAKSIATQNTE